MCVYGSACLTHAAVKLSYTVNRIEQCYVNSYIFAFSNIINLIDRDSEILAYRPNQQSKNKNQQI